MSICTKSKLQVLVAVCGIIMATYYFMMYHKYSVQLPRKIPAPKQSTHRSQLTNWTSSPGPCTCVQGSLHLKTLFTEEQYDELKERRTEEYKKHKARTSSVLSNLLLASSNSPLQYPIQGFRVRPFIRTLIPGLELHAEERSSYKVVMKVSKGVLTTEIPAVGATITGSGETELTIESDSLVILNDLLAKVSYTSTIYHIDSGDLASFQFENHKAVFPIVIKEPKIPILYDFGPDINSQVTITTKTFLRYAKLRKLLDSVQKYYENMTVIVADDSLEPEKVTGENVQHYIMPPARGLFPGQFLAISQVTTKYFVWVDDDFLFNENTKLEKMVEVLEANPGLDVVGAAVGGHQFRFTVDYEEGDEIEGGCLHRKLSGHFKTLPGFPECFLASGVVNFFMGRTDSVKRVGYDARLKLPAHSEFFIDAFGSLMVASCRGVSIGHQSKQNDNVDRRYRYFRFPAKKINNIKLLLHYFKNHLKCVHY